LVLQESNRLMSKLLVHPSSPDTDGRILSVTPQSAGWSYVGFEVFRLPAGQVLRRATEGNEICLVILSGRAQITAGSLHCGTLGERANVFEGLPWSVYVPAHSHYAITADGACEIAICACPSKGGYEPRVITPADVGEETRGQGTNTRHVRNILPDTSPYAENLLVVEVITPGGNWSSYPPHKHDTDDYPNETYLEETYYHRLNPPQGFGFQRVYTDDGTLDESFAIKDGDVVLVPKGFHPVAAPHGFDLYYLNVMAGPKKAWKFTMSKDHAHIGWTSTAKK
jgi:5-deoxy-glucuronate isomerase